MDDRKWGHVKSISSAFASKLESWGGHLMIGPTMKIDGVRETECSEHVVSILWPGDQRDFTLDAHERDKNKEFAFCSGAMFQIH